MSSRYLSIFVIMFKAIIICPILLATQDQKTALPTFVQYMKSKGREVILPYIAEKTIYNGDFRALCNWQVDSLSVKTFYPVDILSAGATKEGGPFTGVDIRLNDNDEFESILGTLAAVAAYKIFIFTLVDTPDEINKRLLEIDPTKVKRSCHPWKELMSKEDEDKNWESLVSKTHSNYLNMLIGYEKPTLSDAVIEKLFLVTPQGDRKTALYPTSTTGGNRLRTLNQWPLAIASMSILLAIYGYSSGF